MANYPKRMCEQDAAFILEYLERNKVSTIGQMVEKRENGGLSLLTIELYDEAVGDAASVRMGAFGAVFTLYDNDGSIEVDSECMADDDFGGFVYVNMDAKEIAKHLKKPKKATKKKS